jgi:hypothetical protein
MRYLKTFESFAINESSDQAFVDLGNTLQQKVEAEYKNNPEQVKEQIEKLAKNLGLTIDQMTDPKLVEDAMKKKGLSQAVTESIKQGELASLNEGIVDKIKSAWNASKNKIYDLMAKWGLVGGLASAITAVGTLAAQGGELGVSASEKGMDTQTLIASGIAFAISIAAHLAGAKKADTPFGEKCRKFYASR